MNILPKAISKVIESFESLPGIGPKTAQRLSFYLLHMPQDALTRFADSIRTLKEGTVLCAVCKNVSESDPCPICSSSSRDKSMICVVEQPTDVIAIERTGTYKGVYHVLHGAINPLDNIGPDEIYVGDLIKRVKNATIAVREIIFAMNASMEGEATAMYIAKEIKNQSAGRQAKANGGDIEITRLAHGLPIGADIEYADEVTLTRALEGRRRY